MASCYYAWSVKKLKEELRKRGAVTHGRKESLIERLEFYDRNDDFKGDAVMLPPDVIPNWPCTGFRQLCLEHKILLPKVASDQIESYFIYRLAGDNEQTKDIKAIEKGKALLQSSRIEACSIHYTRNDFHLTGIVMAAMKKKVTYNYKIRLHGQTGEVINSHCECPAGKGPHGTCKHLAAVLLMICHFVCAGEILVRKTCTENLQTFHRPQKTHIGSPVKAEDIATKGGKRKVNMDDPRPLKFRNVVGYQDHVRNLTLNFCANRSQDITLRFLYPKADLQAAVNDHDYLSIPFTEYWVDNHLKITDKFASKLQASTKQQSRNVMWREERRWRITASHFGDVCKATMRRNKTTLCRNIVFPKPLLCKPILHGKQCESKALKSFEVKKGLKVDKSGLFVSSEIPFLGASPDGLVGTENIIEVKCPYSGRDSMISPGPNFPFLEHNKRGDTKLRENHKYFIQIQGQLYISKRKLCYFVVYTSKDLFIQEVSLDAKYCEGYMLPKVERFYNDHLRPFIAQSL